MKASRQGLGFVSKVTITNSSDNPVCFKFKTNASTKFSCKPVYGAISPNSSENVYCNNMIN